MIDIHCHIIPGVDDGAYDREESLIMGRMAEACGVTDIIVTPHCNIPRGFFNFCGHDYDAAVGSLRRAFGEAGINLRLHRGMEVFGMDDTAGMLDDDSIITLAASKYLLIEFAFDDDMWRVRDVLRSLLRRGITPIVAHPERYYPVMDDLRFALDWVDMGCLLQLNRTSLLYGPDEPEAAAAFELLELRAAHFIATDAHDTTYRTTELVDAYDLISEKYSPEWAWLLMQENPRRVLENEEVLSLSPLRRRV